jgi:pimeloyl-ACP methyl ester carboxylesterase
MIEFPVLLATVDGVMGGVVTTPEATPRAAMVILHGARSTRAGTNRVWADTARSLAELGVVTFRMDYPGLGESHGASRADRLEGMTETLDWFRERTTDLHLLVVGVCAGVLPAAELARRDPDVCGFAAITPPLLPGRDAVPPPRAPFRRRIAHRARRMPKRAYLWARYGIRQVRQPTLRLDMFANAADTIRELARRVPVWVLTGERDMMAPAVRELAPELTTLGNCRVEFVEGSLYSYPTPGAQEVQHDRVLEWATSSLAQELSA